MRRELPAGTITFLFTDVETDKDVSIGGAGLAAQAIELGLVDELRMFRNPCSAPPTWR